MISIDKSLSVNKEQLLSYFRDRANESLEVIRRTYPKRHSGMKRPGGAK